MSRIFLSHSSKNERQAIALRDWLSEQRPELANEIFLDTNPQTGLQPGQRWKEALRRANDRCEAVICLLSADWQASSECKTEYRVAETLGKQILVARLEDLGDSDITSEWQRCDLFAAGPTTAVPVRRGPPVRFNTAALDQLKKAIEGTGIGPEHFPWPQGGDRHRAPYRGWAPLEDIDAGVFFGRDAAIILGLDALRAMRLAGLESLFVVLGPSGSGKSSFLRAGLIPRLQRDNHHFLTLGIMRPAGGAVTGDHGFAAAIHSARVALRLSGAPFGEIKHACLHDPDRVVELLRDVRTAALQRLVDVGQEGVAPTLVLPLDQAEELFTADLELEGEQFLALIAEVIEKINAGETALIVAATIRADRYEAMHNHPALDRIGTKLFNKLKPMPPSQFKEVITGPAERFNEVRTLSIEPALVNELLIDASSGGGDALPLLALTLASLFKDYGSEEELTLEHYQQLGGMRRVVQHQIDAALAAVPGERAAKLEQLRAAFIPWLATINPDNDQPLRRQARWGDLPEASRPMVDAFVEQRLLIEGTRTPADGERGDEGNDDNGREPFVEVALESLLRQWDHLVAWLDEERENLKTADEIKRLARSWEASGRDDSWLLTGTRLATAQAISLRQGFDKLLAEARSFLDASRQHEDSLLEAQKRTRSGLGAGLQARSDRIRLALARSITAVIGADNDALSMVNAIAKILGERSRLAVIVDHSDAERLRGLRDTGALVVAIDTNRPEALASLPIWGQLDRLYLLAPDPGTNLRRLEKISQIISAKSRKRRVPLIVRIDDPWQAESWRARQFGSSDNRWAADAVGVYEVTATRLLDRIIDSNEYGEIGRLLICGTSPLTFALCGNLAQRRMERAYYTAPKAHALPTVSLVDEAADEYRADLDHYQRQAGRGSTNEWLEAVRTHPSLQALTPIVNSGAGLTGSTAAVIFTQEAKHDTAGDVMLGTRLASRFPELPIFVLDSAASEVQQTASVMAQLHSYRLGMGMPHGQATDLFERTAMLIHERSAAGAYGLSPAAVPWAQLQEFYKGSIRRQVENALWMVEEIAGHTWDTWTTLDAQQVTVAPAEADPLERLRLLGFDRAAALAMAKAEHEDWVRYCRRAGWRYGPTRDISRKIHPKLLPWSDVLGDSSALHNAVENLAATLEGLRALGYRSRPVWDIYRRVGFVAAERHRTRWTWTTETGQTMHASAGDWEVCDNGRSWSVRDDIFRSSYRQVSENRWERVGTVLARPARTGEIVDTLEGPVTAAEGDWVIKGDAGEQWAVPGDRFSRQYNGPIPPD